MKKRYLLVGLTVAIIAGYINLVPARSVSSASSFYRYIEKNRFAMAMFYRQDKEMKKNNRELYDRISDAKDSFERLDKVRNYKRADMKFIRANVEEKKLASVPGDFGLSVQQEPVYILFRNGKAVTSPSGSTAFEHGFLSQPRLRSFIDSKIGGDIEDYLADEEVRRRERKADTRVYFGAGGGYPWYGYYPYYGGWGYPYYGYGYGGRVGFGVSFGV